MNDKLCNHRDTDAETGKTMICTREAGHAGWHTGKPLPELEPACYGEYVAAERVCRYCDSAVVDGKCSMGCDYLLRPSPHVIAQPARQIASAEGVITLTPDEALAIISAIERVLDSRVMLGVLLMQDCRSVRDTLHDKLRAL